MAEQMRYVRLKMMDKRDSAGQRRHMKTSANGARRLRRI